MVNIGALYTPGASIQKSQALLVSDKFINGDVMREMQLCNKQGHLFYVWDPTTRPGPVRELSISSSSLKGSLQSSMCDEN